jgi:hypothetical protein
LEIFRFDRAERLMTHHDSRALHVTRVATSDGPARLTCLSVGPDGVIGTHPALLPQLLLIVSGEGWVAGAGGLRVPVTAGQGVRWEDGEVHTSGTETGFTALALEGTAVTLVGGA